MITADQARKNVKKMELGGIEEIYKQIEAASLKGSSAISLTRSISKGTVSHLENNGFICNYYESSYQREPSYWTISW